MENQNEIIIYQPEESIKLEVRLEDETVWLTQAQMAELFQTSKQNISLHTRNVFKENELSESATVKYSLTVQQEGKRIVKRNVAYYNLDVIISVGYRVKSQRGVEFRQWATRILKDYLLKGYAINRRIEQLEKTVADHTEKIDFFIRTSLPPVEGIFYDGQIFDAYAFATDLIKSAKESDGQIFDAYAFATDLIKSAKESIILIDNYVDETTLLMLSKRMQDVEATIYTNKVDKRLQLDIQKHNEEYTPIKLFEYKQAHDRFLLIDTEVYHIGASLKDLGKKWFAFSRLHIEPTELLERINK